MGIDPLLSLILDDERLTRGLGDAEARILVEWLVEQAENLARAGPPRAAEEEVRRLCRRGRAFARFVALWCLDRRRGGAGPRAAAARVAGAQPDGPAEPCELMHAILRWEGRELERARELAARLAA